MEERLGLYLLRSTAVVVRKQDVASVQEEMEVGPMASGILEEEGN